MIRRSWQVVVLGVLLVAQAAVLGSLGVWQLVWLDRPPLALVRGLVGAVLAVVAPLALAAGLGMLAGWRRAWVLAIAAQGLGLLAALVLYVRERPGYAPLVLAGHVVLVILLNGHELRAAFGAGGRAR